MVWMMGHYPDCNSGLPCLVVDDYKKKHNLRPSAGTYVLFKNITCPGARDKLNFRQDKRRFSHNVRQTSKKIQCKFIFPYILDK